MTTRPAKPTVRYSAIKSARTVGSANVELHHHGGRDRDASTRDDQGAIRTHGIRVDAPSRFRHTRYCLWAGIHPV